MGRRIRDISRYTRRARRALRLLLLMLCSLCSAVCASPADEGSALSEVTLVRDVKYRDGESRSWTLDLAQPRSPTEKPRPAIVVIHGGGWIEGDKSSFSTIEHRVPGNILDFARLGFVAVTINYRLAGEAPFPAALDDCRCAVRWLRAHAREYGVDPAHIGAWGNSAGGHLALLLGLAPGEPGAAAEVGPWLDQSPAVQAVVSDSGPVDLAAQFEQGTLRTVVAKFLGGPPQGDLQAIYARASPISHVKADECPLLLIYGAADNQVPVETVDRFVLALQQSGHPDISYLRLAKVDHCPHSLVRVPWLPTVVTEFFARTLQDNRAAALSEATGR